MQPVPAQDIWLEVGGPVHREQRLALSVLEMPVDWGFPRRGFASHTPLGVGGGREASPQIGGLTVSLPLSQAGPATRERG